MLRPLICVLVFTVAMSATAEPRLVLQITVDGFRADLLTRNQHNFGNGGFRYLLEKGLHFTEAHYLHANTETIVGHTTLSTGATPAVHGMVGNVWFNGDSGELGYNIEDPEAPLLPTRKKQTAGVQVDPAQKRAKASGRSPRGILVPTFSDSLTIATGGAAKVFGVSGKDRSAVAMAGHTGTAYWYSTDSGDFVTSAYYMDAYPDWVKAWNAAGNTSGYGGTEWELLLDIDRYDARDRDDRSYEVDLKGYGRTFPHALGPADHPLFLTRVLVGPAGDALLADFAMALVDAEGIGNDAVTDYLSLSFSGVDAVNHFFGPSSLETEDTVLRLDRTLAKLLSFIDKRVGLKNTLIVLSADHGIAEMPEYAAELGHTAGRLYSDEVLSIARDTADALYGQPELIKDFFRPYLYLDAEQLAAAGLDRNTVAAEIGRAMAGHPGIGGAVGRGDVSTQATRAAERAVAHNHHPERSGDIYLYQAPYWFMFDRGAVAAMHGSPWRYDQHVPVLFAGQGIRKGRVDRVIHPIDVAPTLAALLGIMAPAGAQGGPLEEVLHRR